MTLAQFQICPWITGFKESDWDISLVITKAEWFKNIQNNLQGNERAYQNLLTILGNGQPEKGYEIWSNVYSYSDLDDDQWLLILTKFFQFFEEDLSIGKSAFIVNNLVSYDLLKDCKDCEIQLLDLDKKEMFLLFRE